MKTIVVIPARGGSERIPNKSLQKIGERTLLERAIDHCKESKIIDRIIVSTDSREIADVAESNGINVPFLRQEFGDSLSPVSLATMHTIEQHLRIFNIPEKSTIVQVMPNCPFIKGSTIDKFINDFRNIKESSSILSCVRLDPINRFAFELHRDGSPAYLHSEINFRTRTQDFSPLFVASGAVWVSSLQSLLKNRDFYSPGYKFKEIDFWEGYDIDETAQLTLARIYAETTGQ